jgi:hypothetical protein
MVSAEGEGKEQAGPAKRTPNAVMLPLSRTQTQWWTRVLLSTKNDLSPLICKRLYNSTRAHAACGEEAGYLPGSRHISPPKHPSRRTMHGDSSQHAQSVTSLSLTIHRLVEKYVLDPVPRRGLAASNLKPKACTLHEAWSLNVQRSTSRCPSMFSQPLL